MCDKLKAVGFLFMKPTSCYISVTYFSRLIRRLYVNLSLSICHTSFSSSSALAQECVRWNFLCPISRCFCNNASVGLHAISSYHQSRGALNISVKGMHLGFLSIQKNSNPYFTTPLQKCLTPQVGVQSTWLSIMV